jgi:hypothetical protein
MAHTVVVVVVVVVVIIIIIIIKVRRENVGNYTITATTDIRKNILDETEEKLISIKNPRIGTRENMKQGKGQQKDGWVEKKREHD